MSEGYVYFIEREPGDYVKIGWAKHGPFVRISELQTGCPDLLTVRAYFRGTREDERRMHQTFADLRGRGEWFANVLRLSEMLAYFEDVDAHQRPVTEEELVTALHDCVLTSNYYPGYPVSELAYDDSGDWRPWAHLFAKYSLLETVQ